MGLVSFKDFNSGMSIEEGIILNDILDSVSINESFSFTKVLDKIKSYAKKGALTATIIASLLGNSSFSQTQLSQIEDAASIEMSYSDETSDSEKIEATGTYTNRNKSMAKRLAIINAKVEAGKKLGEFETKKGSDGSERSSAEYQLFNPTILSEDYEETDRGYKCTIKMSFEIKTS